jgi:SAM-dependent methyltransferase
VLNLMTEEEDAAVKPFLQAYERVRSTEKWGGDDLDLPFHPARHHRIWAVRQRTFQAFKAAVKTLPRGFALDIGAGNCWMTRYLDQWSFDAIAVDINTSPADGLEAGQHYIDQGAVFLRVRAPMERLPFASGRIRLLATNASFHYASDYRATLLEFKRVLTPGGTIAIIDTPFYENSADGDRMIAERVVEFRERYGIPEGLARQSGYMTFNNIYALASSCGLNCRVHHVWPGLARKYEEWRGRLAGRRVAAFPLVLLEKA